MRCFVPRLGALRSSLTGTHATERSTFRVIRVFEVLFTHENASGWGAEGQKISLHRYRRNVKVTWKRSVRGPFRVPGVMDRGRLTTSSFTNKKERLTG